MTERRIDLSTPEFQTSLPLQEAIYKNPESAFIASLGESFTIRFKKATPLAEDELRNPHENPFIGYYVTGESEVWKLKDVEINPTNPRLPSEKSAFVDEFGPDAWEALQRQKEFGGKYNFHKGYGRDPKVEGEELPGVEILEKSGKWEKKDSFYKVTHPQRQRGEQVSKMMYVSPQKTEKNGMETRWDEVYIPQYDEEGNIKDFKTVYVYHRPTEQEAVRRERTLYVVKQKGGPGNTHLVQVLCPIEKEYDDAAEYKKGEFENIFLGIVDPSSRRTLDVTGVLPYAHFISSKRYPNTPYTHPAYPVFYLPRAKDISAGDIVGMLARQEAMFEALAKGVDSGVLAHKALAGEEALKKFYTAALGANLVSILVNSINTQKPLIERYKDDMGLLAALFTVGVPLLTNKQIRKSLEMRQGLRRKKNAIESYLMFNKIKLAD